MAAPELYVIVEAGQNSAPALSAGLAAAPVASVLIVPQPGQTFDPAVVKQLIGTAQSKGIAALLADNFELARQLKADGVHLSWSKNQIERYAEAREYVGARFIVGADAGRSRDDAMTLGENGADYVAFGIPPHVEDRDTAFQRQCELLSWWAEIFEPPCVALDASDADAARALARSSADFVSVVIPDGTPEALAAARIKEFAAAISGTAAVA